MGLTTGTLFVHGEGMSPEALRDALRPLLAPAGMTPAAEDDADITLYLLAMPGSPWLAIYAEDYVDGFTDEVLAQARAIARTLSTPCVGTYVLDSDVSIVWQIGPAGEDLVVGDLEAAEAWEMELPGGEGNPQAWVPLLAEGADINSLPAIWHGDYVCAEEMLRAFAPLIGIDPDCTTLCLEDLEEEDPPEGAMVLCLYYM